MIVLDTSVISAFSEIGRFHLLKEILNRLGVKAVIPHTVELKSTGFFLTNDIIEGILDTEKKPKAI